MTHAPDPIANVARRPYVGPERRVADADIDALLTWYGDVKLGAYVGGGYVAVIFDHKGFPAETQSGATLRVVAPTAMGALRALALRAYEGDAGEGSEEDCGASRPPKSAATGDTLKRTASRGQAEVCHTTDEPSPLSPRPPWDVEMDGNDAPPAEPERCGECGGRRNAPRIVSHGRAHTLDVVCRSRFHDAGEVVLERRESEPPLRCQEGDHDFYRDPSWEHHMTPVCRKCGMVTF